MPRHHQMLLCQNRRMADEELLQRAQVREQLLPTATLAHMRVSSPPQSPSRSLCPWSRKFLSKHAVICCDGVKVHRCVTRRHATLSPHTHSLPLDPSHPLSPVRSCEEAQKDYEVARKKVPVCLSIRCNTPPLSPGSASPPQSLAR